jgi:signal transduction histidine kinase
MRETLRRLREVEREISILPRSDEKVQSVDQILARHSAVIPRTVAADIRRELKAVIEHDAVSQELLGQHLNLLGTLATAGMFALAFEHEIARQITVLEELSGRLQASGKLPAQLGLELDKWIRRVRQTRSIFSALSDEESRMKRQRFVAKSAIQQFVVQAQPFITGIEVDLGKIDDDLRLPGGSFAEWSALFQNVFANAANAMIEKKYRKMEVSSRSSAGTASILVQDTGVGVDLQESERLFEPFERRIKISAERRSLAIGGTGLGLFIVRLIAQNLHCSVSFVRPRSNFATCFQLQWQERG